MDHKAERILNKVYELIKHNATTGKSIVRGRYMDWSENELPAISIMMGSDEISDESTMNLSFVDSILTINFEIVVCKYSYVDVERQLNIIKAELIQAIRTDYNLGLSWVIDVNEIGSDEPEISGDNELVLAKQNYTFTVKYRRSIIDPRL